MYHPQLKTFLQVAETGSFTKASEKLYVTPASVMKQINSLEDRIGIKLFMRTNQGVMLTPAGQAFYREAIKIIELSEKAISNVKKIEGSSKYILRIGTSLLNPCRTFFTFWKSISEKHLEYQLNIVTFEDDHSNILSILEHLGKDFDFFVGTCGSRSWLSRCSFYPLGYHYLNVAVPYGHPLAGSKMIDLSDLHENTLMMGKRGDSEFIDKFRDRLETEHPEIMIKNTSYFYDADIFNECERTGSVLLTLDAWKDVHPSLITIPLKEKVSNPYGIIYAKNCSDEMKEFIEVIKASINSLKTI